MADFDTDYTGSGPDETDAARSRRRGPSILLLLAAIAALAVSGWALIGPFSLDPLANVEFRWVFVAVAVAVGAALLFAPGKRSCRKD
ncbi:hypothetical protein ACWDTG_25800 [Rhodococcus zopfii]|uniref:Uncharacterized protein n=1 Tax=Rhodococcus zopfii TaxID=43772 RepID=A0ABU3WLD8_9NOCA|nr:hypothetical protein [Rhodococcus zopfii]MDV2474771.1 hypothetical protein [Rhodococcus zopfii]